eukprot:CAMPEP_0202454434 /NCGR_PEP_ID=MMETSP1360-20130828/12165_1 /ASSEMBLY_ACC=CAM_ASM_000848 /TAXON_ID=515479 /ORGANISM="Licmophora paradoxa, Strain CCMP2313" /LENGTH=893 /DNA_ID=CAMNT_0049073743 /DNA_START=109 /DNA_END=2790 /DNA_ORIENTATION=-
MSNNLKGLEKQLNDFIDKENLIQGKVLSGGKLFAFFDHVADSIQPSSPWIQTAPDFQALLKELGCCCVRYKLDKRYGFPEGGRVVRSIESIELIKQQTLSLLTKLQDTIPTLPEEFRNQAEISLSHLDEVRQRVKQLRLTVSFIGPAKSGKSTTINAILGVDLFPSDTFPCTVIPTTIRHKPGQKSPTLHLSEEEIGWFQAAIKKLAEKEAAIRSLLPPDLERRCLDEIGGGGCSLLQKSTFNGSAAITEVLEFMNQFCRLHARAERDDILDGGNPLQNIVRAEQWPVIEVEMEFLKDLEIVGEFEIIDSPGRDETLLIPEIEPAIKCAMKAAAAVVCVMNSQTAMTDSAYLIKRELSSVLAFKQPIFILANRIDGLGIRLTERALTKLETNIGKSFLNPSYSGKASNRQVFGVSARLALNASFVSRSLNSHERLFAVRELPDLRENEDESGEFCTLSGSSPTLDKGTIEALISTLGHLHGDWNWTDVASRYDETQLKQDLQRINEISRFTPFRDKLMKELAPRAGQKVLGDQISHILTALQELAESMDLFISGMLEGEEENRDRYNKLTQQLDTLNNIVSMQIKIIVKENIETLETKLRNSKNDVELEVKERIESAFLRMKVEGLKQFEVKCPPTPEELDRYEHLREGKVKGKYYFIALHQDSGKLFNEMTETVQRHVMPYVEDFVHQHLYFLGLASLQLRENLITSLEGKIKGIDEVVASISKNLPTPTPLYLSPPNDLKGITTKEKVKVRKWYYLWMGKVWMNTGVSVLVIPFDDAKERFMEQVAPDLVNRMIDSSIQQCNHHLEAMARKLIKKFVDGMDRIRSVLLYVKRERTEIEKRREKAVGVAKSRIILKCIITELHLLKEQSEAEAGSNMNDLLINPDLVRDCNL